MQTLHEHSRKQDSPTPGSPDRQDVVEGGMYVPAPGIASGTTLRRLNASTPHESTTAVQPELSVSGIKTIRRSPETAELAKAGKKAAPAVLPEIDDLKLYNIAYDLYKGTFTKNFVGDGTTMDAIRYERASGKLTKGRGHEQKGEEYHKALTNWRKKNEDTASDRDFQFCDKLMDDLEDALDGD